MWVMSLGRRRIRCVAAALTTATTTMMVMAVMGVAAAGPLWAGAPVEDAGKLSNQLYEQANKATTFAQLNQILTRVDALRASGVNPQLDKYLTDLQAWVLHRRGEAYVKQAAEASVDGQADLSRQLDGKAMQDFDAAIKLDPSRWKSFHHRGVCFALAGEFEKALSDFSRTIELRPTYESAWFNRGEIHYEMGQFAKAIADYDEAIRLQGTDAGYFTSRGHAHFQLRQFDAALDDYSRAVQLDPRNPERITYHGEACRSMGRWEQAANDFRQAVTLDNQFGRAFQSAAWLMATCPDEQYRHADLALRAARKAIELDGDQDYIYLDTLAAALANAGQFDAAQEVVRQAIRLAPPVNAGPLRQRLDLYRRGQPFRQSLEANTRRVARTPGGGQR